MNMGIKILLIIFLIGVSVFLSISEISLASARKLKLQMMVDEGSKNAQKVMEIQESSGNFFTAVQIGTNAVSILAGIVGDGIAAPYIESLIRERFEFLSPQASLIGGILSFVIITGLFIEFADLIPRRMAMVAPEKIISHSNSQSYVCTYKSCKTIYFDIQWGSKFYI